MGSAASGGGQPRAETNPYLSHQPQYLGATNRAAEDQSFWSNRLMESFAPFLESIAGQGNQLSRTGNIVQQNSLLGTLTESARSGVAKGRAATMDQLGRGRLAGTPFGQRILADQAIQGEMSIAGVKPNFYQWFLPMALQATTGNFATTQQGFSSASGAEANRLSSQMGAEAAILGSRNAAEAQRISSQVGAQGQYSTQQASNYGSMMTKMIPNVSFGFGG